MAEKYSIVYMHHTVFIHSSINGHLGWFHVLAIIKKRTGMNIRMNVSFGAKYFSGYMLWSEITESYDS